MTKIGKQQFYLLNGFVLLILFLRQITDISLLNDYGNMILGPIIFISFLFLGLKSSYEIKKIMILLIYMIISLAVSIFFGHDDYLKIFSEILSLFLFIIIIPSIEATEEEIEKIFKIICVFFVVLIVMKTLSDFELVKITKYTFINKNSWAQSLLFPFFISFYLYVKNNKKRFALLALASFILIVFSYSRTAIVAIFTFIFFYYILRIKESKSKLFVLTAICIFSIIVIIFRNSFITYIVNHYTRKGYNLLTNRNLLWYTSLDAFKSSPIFGVGRGMAEELIRNSGFGMSNREYHSFYFEILAYGGIISTLLYGYLFLNAFKNGLKLRRLNNKIGSVVLSAIISIFVYMLAESFYPFGFSLNNYISGIFLFSIPAMYIKGKIKSNFNEKV